MAKRDLTPTQTSSPQAEQMADESMVRNLEAQAIAIWPQERLMVEGYRLAPDINILDLGCGTGEITAKLAECFREATLLGLDLIESHLELARQRCRPFGDRVRFECGDALDLKQDDNSFDLAVCRHMIQAVSDPANVLSEMKRVIRPGGRLHVLAEDYGMIHMPSGGVDIDHFWHKGVIAYGDDIGTDLRIGRKIYRLLRQLDLCEIDVNYVTVDTCKVDRNIFAAVMEAWRDGYSEAIVRHSSLTEDEVKTSFAAVIAAIRDPDTYCAWQVPIVTAIVPQ